MKLKIILLVAGLVMAGSTVIVIVMQPPQPAKLPPALVSQLPTTMSNYSKTFKLKTSPPIWGQPTNGNH